MIWLTWRQHRIEIFLIGGMLVGKLADPVNIYIYRHFFPHLTMQ